MLFDIENYLIDDILVKVDRASMSVALEVREPFLDNRLIELSLAILPEFKWKDGKSKWILRKILGKYVSYELFEKPKHRFSVPVYEWFKKDLKDIYLSYLSSDRIRKAGIFRWEKVKKRFDGHFEDVEQTPWEFWLLFVFEIWREKWFL